MNPALQSTAAPLAYLVAAIAFFLSLSSVTRVRVAARARGFAVAGLGFAILGTLLEVGPQAGSSALGAAVVIGLGAGAMLATRVAVNAPPARFGFIPGLGGAAAALIAAAAWGSLPGSAGANALALGLALLLGALALVIGVGGSLRGSASTVATAATALAATFAGWAIAALGFALGSAILLIAGGVVGTAAFAFGRLVARAAGRSFVGVLTAGHAADDSGYQNVRACGTDEAAVVLESASTVLVVPGFGMPAAQAQHTVKEVAEQLEKKGAQVFYALHPAAGCLPGHMNIALDEANVPHDKLVDLERAQQLVAQADAVLVVGANDTINPSAATDQASPLYGMGALDLAAARAVFVVKRSLRPGAAGVKNPLFERPNTMMMFGDGKRVMQALVAELKGAAH